MERPQTFQFENRAMALNFQSSNQSEFSLKKPLVAALFGQHSKEGYLSRFEVKLMYNISVMWVVYTKQNKCQMKIGCDKLGKNWG